jgi:hypothetical protein
MSTICNESARVLTPAKYMVWTRIVGRGWYYRTEKRREKVIQKDRLVAELTFEQSYAFGRFRDSEAPKISRALHHACWSAVSEQ